MDDVANTNMPRDQGADDDLRPILSVKPIVITAFAKDGGPLTKRIHLDADGAIVSDGSACVMTRGTARRVHIGHLGEFADLIEALEPHEAIALGALRPELPDDCDIVTKATLDAAQPNRIARTGDNITYRPDQPALVLLDHDTKGMPRAVQDKLAELGGFWPALVTVMPEIADIVRVERRSTSAGLSREDTSAELPGSNGVHVYLMIANGADAVRFLTVLHHRCWLAGFGWMMVGAAGQLLERSIVDRMVGMAERLVFEGAPVLAAPLVQDRASRVPTVHGERLLDTALACPTLTVLERARLDELLAKEAQRLVPESARSLKAFKTVQAKRLATKRNIPIEQATGVVARWAQGVLRPDVELPFDDPELAGKTVGDVLDDPERFEGETLADPLEGVAYGRCKAKVLRRLDGSPMIHSYAHGRRVYQLKYDAPATAAAIASAEGEAAVNTFVRLALDADLDDVELDKLITAASGRGDIKPSVVKKALKDAKARQTRARREETARAKAAERTDPRPRLPAPPSDGEDLPVMSTLTDASIASTSLMPPWRDIDDAGARMRMRRIPNTHAFLPETANVEETTP